MSFIHLLTKIPDDENIRIAYNGEYTEVMTVREFTRGNIIDRATRLHLECRVVELVWYSKLYNAITIELIDY